ncbi:MAG: hypothetical protein KDA52_23295, partial [Planctomycetaceae bacterium]|nr:hypothetical protein [Planctomycetaceae bacterium]
MKRNRLTDALRTSVLAERVVEEIVDQLIASWESLPRDGHHVLSLQVELLASLEHELSPQAREVLSGVNSSGKAAKLARQLCVMQASPASVPMKQAAIKAAKGRLTRADRSLSATGGWFRESVILRDILRVHTPCSRSLTRQSSDDVCSKSELWRDQLHLTLANSEEP